MKTDVVIEAPDKVELKFKDLEIGDFFTFRAGPTKVRMRVGRTERQAYPVLELATGMLSGALGDETVIKYHRVGISVE